MLWIARAVAFAIARRERKSLAAPPTIEPHRASTGEVPMATESESCDRPENSGVPPQAIMRQGTASSIPKRGRNTPPSRKHEPAPSTCTATIVCSASCL